MEECRAKMSMAQPRLTRRILLFVFFGLLVLAVYFYYFVGTSNIIDALKRVNFFYYVLAFVAFVVDVLFYSLAWQSLLKNVRVSLKIRRVFLFTWAGMFFDATVPDPGWSGDLSKAYMLGKTSGEDTGRIVASVVGQKIIITVVTVFSLVLGLVLLAAKYTITSIVLVFSGVVLSLLALSLVIVVYLSSRPLVTKAILNWLIRLGCSLRRGRWDPSSFRLKAEETLNTFHEGIKTLSANPKSLILPVAFSLVSWGFDVLVTFLTFIALGYPVPVYGVLIVYASTGTLQTFGVSIIGFTEVVMSSFYTILGIQPAISLAVTLLARIVTLWFKLAVSYVAFQWVGIQILKAKKENGNVKLGFQRQ